MLSQLCADFFARSAVLAWPLVALVIFMAVFVATTLRALLAGRETMQRHAELPLDSSEVNKHG